MNPALVLTSRNCLKNTSNPRNFWERSQELAGTRFKRSTGGFDTWAVSALIGSNRIA